MKSIIRAGPHELDPGCAVDIQLVPHDRHPSLNGLTENPFTSCVLDQEGRAIEPDHRFDLGEKVPAERLQRLTRAFRRPFPQTPVSALFELSAAMQKRFQAQPVIDDPMTGRAHPCLAGYVQMKLLEKALLHDVGVGW